MEVLWRACPEACPEACQQTSKDGNLPAHLLLDNAYFQVLRTAAVARGRASPAEALTANARAADNPFELRFPVATVVATPALAKERDDRCQTASLLTHGGRILPLACPLDQNLGRGPRLQVR